MKKSIMLIVTAVLVVGSAVAASAGERILFAIAGPMTGDSAAQGIQMRNGATIAVDEVNAAGGINGKKL